MYRKAHLATAGSTVMLAALAAGAALTGTAAAAPNGPDQINIVNRTSTTTQPVSNSGPSGRTQADYGAESGPVTANLNRSPPPTRDSRCSGWVPHRDDQVELGRQRNAGLRLLREP